jgi:2-dehydro-3-deoxyphosphogluconate aldolase/(4S)-4-hydroxy-2-oxoglutarate aldolase
VVAADPTARSSPVAVAIRACRLVVVLRRVTPQSRLLELVRELRDAGAGVFEVTFDGPDAAADLTAVRDALEAKAAGGAWVGAGTIRSIDQVHEAVAAGAAFGVAPVFDRKVLQAARVAGLPFVAGAYSPTEIDAAWRAGATFVKLFPGSSLGARHMRELRGPMPEIETIVTGGVDGSNALDFLAAGATAVGIGSAIVRATADERRALIDAIAGAPRP